jgi:Family of unknown function (DUF6077)
MYGNVSIGSVLTSLLILAAFVLPGYGWVTWLHAGDRLSRPLRLVLGFAWSFALFSLLGGPFLWFCGTFADFLSALYPLWALFSLAAALAYVRVFRAPGPSAAGRPAGPPAAETPRVPAGAWALLGVYAALGVGLVVVWATGSAFRRALLTLHFPAVLLLCGWLAWRLRHGLGPLLRFGPADETAPRLWTIAAAVAIAVQVVSVVVYYRPDWDDCVYLGAVLEYHQGERLNGRDPTIRGTESGGVGGPYRALCWELWGAVLCSFSGLSPLVVFHSLLPGLLVLGAYAAYAGLFAELLPPRWRPLALLGLSGYHLWGVGSLANASNHFLVRIWQGKSVLLHLALPLAAVVLCRYAGRPGWRWGASLCACLCFGLGASSTAIFLGPALVGCLALALLPTVPAGRLRLLFGCAFALTPLGIEALGILLDTPKEALHSLGLQGAEGVPGSSWSNWFQEFHNQAGGGSAEIIWIASLPLLAALLGGPRPRAYLVAYPALLLLTFANPFLCNAVTAYVTTAHGYYRIFWLFPVGTGLAALLALLARLAERAQERYLPFQVPHAALVVCGLGLAVSALPPGKFVWGLANNLGPFMTPRRAENLEKMPPDLLVIAERLDRDPHVQDGQILCGEEVSSFLIPYSRSFRLVVTRPMYTIGGLLSAGQVTEAAEHAFLLAVADRGKLAEREVGALSVRDVPRLLDRYQVRFAVSSPVLWASDERVKQAVLREREKLLTENSFYALYRGTEYVLWKRGAAPGRP